MSRPQQIEQDFDDQGGSKLAEDSNAVAVWSGREEGGGDGSCQFMHVQQRNIGPFWGRAHSVVLIA